MTAPIEHLALEPLRAIRTDVAELRPEAGATNLQLATMSQQLGALTTTVHVGKSEIEERERRLERVERRLELTEG
jgi:hypothetical protein